jgi:hypothetical protein
MKHFITITLLLVLFAASGCGQRGLSGLSKVSGTITLNGQPLDGATISLSPVTEGLRAASAVSDASGNFKVTTLHPNDGVQPGDYLISVTKVKLEGVLPAAEVRKLLAEGKKYNTPQIQQVPGKYLKAETSDLKITVKPGKNDQLVLTLEGEPVGKLK